MRASLSFASAAVVLATSFFALHCGGETESLGSQGAQQGQGGKSGSAGSGGQGNGPAVGCPAIYPVCGDGKYAVFSDPPTCSSCESCPAIPEFLADCPKGTREVRDTKTSCLIRVECNEGIVACPTIALDCQDGTYETNGVEGCPVCEACPAVPPFLGDCPNGSVDLRNPKTNCITETVCKPAPSCPEIVEPGPNQCPSGGFTPTYGADGCINGYFCKSCPVVGDPSFCANGTITVPIKENGSCDYGNVTCTPCAAAEPPVPNWCNDGGKIVKQEGKCLDAAECLCPSYAACPPNSVSLAIPGSSCGRFDCNKVECKAPPQPTQPCNGNFNWEKGPDGCATKAVCTPFGG